MKRVILVIMLLLCMIILCSCAFPTILAMDHGGNPGKVQNGPQRTDRDSGGHTQQRRHTVSITDIMRCRQWNSRRITR